ncbi:15451_t:CDS:2, partial [Acaulospora colombiana]
RRFRALEILLSYHDTTLFPYRYAILNSIPLYVQPSEYHDLLPANDYDTNVEVKRSPKTWRDKIDWVEQTDVLNALKTSMTPEESTWLDEPDAVDDDEFPRERRDNLLTAEQLTAWYTTRAEAIDSQSGLMDNALALLQHGASQGVPRLDELGEDLLLLDRLIYEAPAPSEPSQQTDWTLYRWKAMEPPDIIKAYLAFSTADSITTDIRRLVLPYLSVLEAQNERAKRADSQLPNRLLYQYILQAPLDLVVSIFESSRPDVPRSNRIIRDDEDVARVALAYLYGLTDVREWSLMSRIFECQPDWGEDRDEDDEAYATLSSLSAFVTPSASRPRATSEELFVFLEPLPSSALSRLLDVLDAHLEGGEILAKWRAAAPLQWFLLSAEDQTQQRARAVMMSRRTERNTDLLENESHWRALIDDMLKLTSTGSEGIKSAFALLSKEEIAKIFFSGILSSGVQYLTGPVVEEICLNVSRELYDNAPSGNIHREEMRMAYECLSVAAPTPRIQQEREFIEATSKISSFSVYIRPGILITPLEIRLTKNRLDLIARVLSSTDDAYKHSNVIMELAEKLGYRNDIAAQVKILSMLVEVALQHEDFVKADLTCQQMVESARTLRAQQTVGSTEISTKEEALEVAWRSCYQLGKQTEFPDTVAKLRLLGFALELCPSTNTLDILSAWRRVETEDIEARKERVAARKAARMSGVSQQRRQQLGSKASVAAAAAAGTLLSSLKGLSQGQDAAAQVLNRVTANFPFSFGGSLGAGEARSSSREGRRSEESERGDRDFGQLFSFGDGSPGYRKRDQVAAGARQALTKGMGWLLGGDEEEEN